MGHNQQEQNVETVPLQAVVYVRISDNPEGTERGADRQEADCRAYAAMHEWEVVAVFRENDTSAFKQRTITLPSGARVRRSNKPSRTPGTAVDSPGRLVFEHLADAG
ncbi:recombinase family protein [Buchananella hordeovulneris]|uniref:recombinase family protein n=1 Tax=Buchananella hordeovulneris TaxID=52770 RepID=UPI000F5EE994|nr:recombinase family protein [Buchananella hordeovulneris]RRD44336.1 hypothetical protein EII13_04355 [Buchananella hordeovulneris]